MKALRECAVGKPVVIEETFPQACTPAELEAFFRESRGIASGWIGHYHGENPEKLKELREAKKNTVPQSMMLDWLELFQKMKPEMTGK